jgi:predicted metal-dependent hydrolase
MKEIEHPIVGKVTFKKNVRSKRITLRVKPNNTITVSLPTRSSFRDAEKILDTHIDWIQKQQAKFKQKQSFFSYDTTFQVRTKPLVIVPTNNDRGCLSIRKNIIEVEIPTNWNMKDDSTQDTIKSAIMDAVRKEAKSYLPDRTKLIAKEKGITVNNVRINKAKTRWGSCSSKKNINLSLFLMLLPEEFIEYVIHHELAHIKHQNHSAAFWDHLEQLLPGANVLDKKLNKHHISSLF